MAKRNRYVGKDCPYCGGVGITTTRDHVLAREFVLPRYRDGLPIVAACKPCNNGKADLERELTVVLPFGGRHADAEEQLQTMVPPRLRGNAKLHREIAGSYGPGWIVSATGSYEFRGQVRVYVDVISRWLELVTLGLIQHHWGLAVGDKIIVEADLATAEQAKIMGQLFALRSGRAVPLTQLGGGVLTYHSAMGVDDPLCSIWRYSLYSGLELAGEDQWLRASDWFVGVRSKGT
jgi:hypothetical protein